MNKEASQAPIDQERDGGGTYAGHYERANSKGNIDKINSLFYKGPFNSIKDFL